MLFTADETDIEGDNGYTRRERDFVYQLLELS